MFYEIMLITFLIYTIFIFGTNTNKVIRETIYDKLKGKTVNELFDKGTNSQKIDFAATAIIVLLFWFFSTVFTWGMLFWISARGVLFSKYYVFTLIAYFIIVMIFLKNNKPIKKEVPLRENVYRYVTTAIEVGIILYTLWVI